MERRPLISSGRTVTLSNFRPIHVTQKMRKKELPGLVLLWNQVLSTNQLSCLLDYPQGAR